MCVHAKRLFGVCQRADLQFQRLIVLLLDLQFGLQFLDEQFEVRDFRAQLALYR